MAEDLQGATPGFAFTEIVSRQCRSVIPRHPLTLLLRAAAVLATASIQVHRLSLRHIRAASGSLLTAGEWLGIVLPPTRHSLTPLRATNAHNPLAAPLTDSPPDIVGRSTAVVPWFPADGAARRGMLWAPDPDADRCMREQPTLGDHGIASSAGSSRLGLSTTLSGDVQAIHRRTP